MSENASRISIEKDYNLVSESTPRSIPLEELRSMIFFPDWLPSLFF